ncbi:ABC transporter substrate-binding protein [Marinibactrum halimedae]|uniref:ABC transporter substrate-binding protein n=2 Tax=Marinibactrum halimedae TaxID=1444977 RepID=A0AA37T5I0_9GAMM|nr:ABC transporter substrate-binding protein [Marinibactrum halimedae]
MMLKVVVVLVLSIITLFTKGQDVASGSNRYLVQDKIIVATGDWPPITAKSGSDKGLASDVMIAAFAAVGIAVDIKFMPWRRAEIELQNQKVEAVFPYAPTVGRKEKFLFGDPIIFSKTQFFKLRSRHDVQIKTLKDLSAYRLGGVLGYFYQEELDIFGINAFYATKDIYNLHKLKTRRIDLFLANDLITWSMIHKVYPESTDDFVALEAPYSVNPLSLMFRKEDDLSLHYLMKFNEGLSLIQQSGLYAELLDKYGYDLSYYTRPVETLSNFHSVLP